MNVWPIVKGFQRNGFKPLRECPKWGWWPSRYDSFFVLYTADVFPRFQAVCTPVAEAASPIWHRNSLSGPLLGQKCPGLIHVHVNFRPLILAASKADGASKVMCPCSSGCSPVDQELSYESPMFQTVPLHQSMFEATVLQMPSWAPSNWRLPWPQRQDGMGTALLWWITILL